MVWKNHLPSTLRQWHNTNTDAQTWPGAAEHGHTTTGSGRMEAGSRVELQGGITRHYDKYTGSQLLLSIMNFYSFIPLSPSFLPFSFIHLPSLLPLLCNGNPAVLTFTAHFLPPQLLFHPKRKKQAKNNFGQREKKFLHFQFHVHMHFLANLGCFVQQKWGVCLAD